MTDNPDRTDALVIGSIVDTAGVVRAKAAPASRLDNFARSGLGASPSWLVFCTDDAIAFTPSFSATGDLRLRIDPDDLRDLGEGTRWAPATVHHQDGEPFAACPRGVLARTVAALDADGLTAKVGHELEFVLFDATEAGQWAAYGLGVLQQTEPFVKDLLSTAARAGLEIEQVHAEYGHNQLEISLPPRAPVAAADDLVLARILISRVARRHGMSVSFAPVPQIEGSGNGAHQHLSLTRAGRALLSGGTGPHGLTAEGGSAIAGLVRDLPEVMAVLASSPLSGLRLKPGMWSGAYCCWGLENREAAVRFCAATPGNPHGANIEVKVVDPAANPYLSSATLLGLALAGIREQLSLPPEVSVPPAQLSDAERERDGVHLLPTDVAEMLERLGSLERAHNVLGPLVIEALTAVRTLESATWTGQDPAVVAEALRFRWTP